MTETTDWANFDRLARRIVGTALWLGVQCAALFPVFLIGGHIGARFTGVYPPMPEMVITWLVMFGLWQVGWGAVRTARRWR